MFKVDCWIYLLGVVSEAALSGSYDYKNNEHKSYSLHVLCRIGQVRMQAA